ncbi:unnamed protein product [Effrenium voratum]|nr:unnamed protein product [Effrenium voratum]
MSWRDDVQAELYHCKSWKQALEVLELLQGTWTNSENHRESYVVTGRSVKRTNDKGTVSFQNHLQWEDQWCALSWGSGQRYFLDTPKPNAKSVSWTAWGRGGKPFRWHRPADSKGEAAEKAEEPLKPRPKAMPRSTQAPPEPKIPKMLQPKPKILPQKVPEPKSMPEQPKKRTSSHPWRGEKQPAKQPRQEEPQAEPAKDADAKDADAKDADAKASPAGKSNAPSQVKASNPETTGWEKERIIARSILVRGFRPDPDKEDALSEPEEAREELVAADPAVKQEADSSTGVGELPMSE